MRETFATLILTRPNAASKRFAQELGPDMPEGATILISPLLSIVARNACPSLEGYAGVIFTSANGVRFCDAQARVPAYCVGAETTRIAQDTGWQAQQSGGSAEALIESLIREKPPSPLLHVGGAHKRGQVAERLTEAGIPTTEVSVYDQLAQDLSDAARGALAAKTAVIVPLFSPRTAALFSEQYQGGAPLHLIAMSPAVMAETEALDAKSRVIASAADGQSMKLAVLEVLRRVEAGDAPL